MGALLIIVAAITWGTTGATMKLVAAGSPMSPLIVGFLRVAIAAPCLWILARWLGDAAPPDHWIDAALPYFNHPGHAQLTLPLLKRALQALPMLAARHKIFFVNRWLAAFIGGQRGDDALAVIRSVLDRRALAADLRLKVLEAMHGLDRDIALRRRWHL